MKTKLWLFFIIVLLTKISAQSIDGNQYEFLDDYDNDKLIEDVMIDNYTSGENEGIIIDETISRTGRDFYNYFYDNWQISNNNEYNIIIQEKPITGIGSRIMIYVNSTMIFERIIQPKTEDVGNTADYAIYVVANYLENFEVIQKQLNGEDLSGTGIY